MSCWDEAHWFTETLILKKSQLQFILSSLSEKISKSEKRAFFEWTSIFCECFSLFFSVFLKVFSRAHIIQLFSAFYVSFCTGGCKQSSFSCCRQSCGFLCLYVFRNGDKQSKCLKDQSLSFFLDIIELMSNIGLFGNTKVGKMPITGHVMDGKFVSAVLNMPLMSEDREALI